MRRINDALDSDPVDIESLRALGLSAYGYVTDDIRCRVWPKLLNVNIFNLPRRKKGTLKCTYAFSDCILGRTIYEQIH